jgi:lycopene beta-cyclase
MEKNPNSINKVDYLFCGGGASATLLLMKMEKSGIINNKKIVVIDPDDKTKNDKTYCFWSKEDEEPASSCKHLISHKWNQACINRSKPELLNPESYFHISGLALYDELRRIAERLSINIIKGEVKKVEKINEGIRVSTSENSWLADFVFDSRPPLYLPLSEQDAHLTQSFLGYVIELDGNKFNQDCVELMDFNVEQDGYTQFVYILPFDSTKLLVELTRFGSKRISPEEAAPVLDKYIKQRFGSYQTLHIEQGNIPMTTVKIETEKIPGLIAIGGRAGNIKPSTGYAFKNMNTHSEKVVRYLKQGKKIIPQKPTSRFALYDRLLLLILVRSPYMGKIIFQKLFQKNSTKKVLKFLDEKTKLNEEISIFTSLPFKPFVNALFGIIKSNIKKVFAPALLLVFCCCLLMINTFLPAFFPMVQIIVLTLGLLWVGIPHGAVDHLIESGSLNSRPKPSFIINYLLLVLLNFVVWLLLPNVALVSFLLMSVWHFGQSDLQDWGILKEKNIKSFVWGFLLLWMILFSHVQETNSILKRMDVWTIPVTENIGMVTAVVFAIFSLAWSFIEQKKKMTLSILMLVMSFGLPLISSFGLYFIGQHSNNSWNHLKTSMKVDQSTLFIKALPFTAGALILFMAMAFITSTGALEDVNYNWLTVFFVFISCISFPHVITMNRFYKKLFRN